MPRSKGEDICSDILEKVLQEGKLTRESFFEICSDLEKQQISLNKKFFELYDLMLRQRSQKEEEKKKSVNFKAALWRNSEQKE